MKNASIQVAGDEGTLTFPAERRLTGFVAEHVAGSEPLTARTVLLIVGTKPVASFKLAGGFSIVETERGQWTVTVNEDETLGRPRYGLTYAVLQVGDWRQPPTIFEWQDDKEGMVCP
jgi:hypothetical protein